jgi:protocatechuate 3,4-dioxygenase beta subunit
MLGPNSLGFSVNQAILFIVGGIAQVFRIIPMIRRWGIPWYAIGIGGTVVFMAVFFITRLSGNPITGRGGGMNTMSILVEIFQAAFIALAAAALVYERRSKKRIAAQTSTGRHPTEKKERRAVAILSGIVVALILSAVFVLPMAMPSPMGGPGGSTLGVAELGGLLERYQSAVQTDASTSEKCNITPSLIEVEGTPQQIEGPYFVDGMPNRSDIRTDTSDGSIEEGVPLSLTLAVYDVDDGNCTPIKGAQVDVWHANSQGVYSGIQQQETSGSNFLRGYQITNDNGTVHFTTVYPGWYEGRAIHIHLKVRMFEGQQKTLEWNSQLYLPNDVNAQVHIQEPYNKHGPVDMVNEQDGIYTGPSTDGLIQNNAGQHLLLLDVANEDGRYDGMFNIVIDAP